MDSGPPIPHTCVKYCQIPSCHGFSSQPNVGFFVSTFDILWLPDITKSQPRYSCCSGSSKVFQCHGLPWTELEGDGTREVDQVSFGRKSTIAIYEVFWCNCDASCFGKYLPRPKCFQKRDNVGKKRQYVQIFHTWSTWDIAQGCSACVMHTYINICIYIYVYMRWLPSAYLSTHVFSPVMFLNKSWNIYLMLWSSLCRLQYPLTKRALQIAQDSVNIHQNFKTGCAAWKITQITTQGLNDTSIQPVPSVKRVNAMNAWDTLHAFSPAPWN